MPDRTGLVDQFGNPIDFRRLKEEQAAASVMSVRQIHAGHPAQGLTPQRLAALLRQAETGDATRYLELAEEMEEKDLHYLAVLGTRKRQVSQLEIQVEPASDSAEDAANAALVQAFIERDVIQDELFDVLDSIGKGYSATEIIWETSERQWMPVRLEWRDPRWFEFDRVSGRRLMLRETAGPVELAPFKFVVHCPKVKSGLPIRGGLARPAAWAYLFKNYGVKDWVAFLETYGQPLRVGKYGPEATPEDKETLLRAVANLGSDAAAIVPSSMVIEFVKAEGGGRSSADNYKALADWLDQQVSKAVLGQTTTTDAISGGHAVSKEHNEVRLDIEQADALQLGAVLTAQVGRPIVDLNRGPQKAYPRIRIRRPEIADVPVLADAVSKLVPLGLKVSQSEIRGKIGLSEPKKEDELLAAPVREAPPEPGADPERNPAAPPDEALAKAGAAAVEDAIDGLVRAAIEDDGWEPAMAPIVAPIRKLVAEAESFEQLRDGLAGLVAEMKPGTLAELLARSAFAARLAGETEADIGGDAT